MSKISIKRRQFQIRAKRKRKAKIKKLIEKYLAAKNKGERDKILEKIQRIAPHYPIEKILKLSKNK